MKKGQSSLEYLVTYGWAFLVIIVTIGALSYFGVINPGKWLPETCDLGQQLQCQDWQMVDDAGEISLYLRNNFGTDIEVVNAVIMANNGQQIGSFGSAILLPSGEAQEVVITDVEDEIYAGEKQQVIFKIEIRKAGPPAGNSHWLTGTIFARVK